MISTHSAHLVRVLDKHVPMLGMDTTDLPWIEAADIRSSVHDKINNGRSAACAVARIYSGRRKFGVPGFVAGGAGRNNPNCLKACFAGPRYRSRYDGRHTAPRADIHTRTTPSTSLRSLAPSRVTARENKDRLQSIRGATAATAAASSTRHRPTPRR
jgi:hypothetical protein